MAVRHTIACAVLVVVPITFWSHAGHAGQDPQEPTTFRSGTRAIEVDVIVTDRKGSPVRDLTKEDFELLEDGVAQRITHLSVIDLSPSDPSDRRSPATGGPDGHPIEGRTIVMMLSGASERVWNAARLFQEHGVGPGDRMAVIYVLGSAKPRLSFTNSRAEMMDAIHRIVRGKGTVLPAGSLPADGIAGRNVPAAAFRVAENVVSQLGAMSGRRKSVVWISPPMVSAASRDPERVIALRDALRAATRNNVAIYAVSSYGLSTNLGLGVLEFKTAYREIAEETGGDALADSNNFAEAFRRHQRDSAYYYLLAYEPAVEHTDGEFHQISVRVKQREANVRARRGYYAPAPASAPIGW